MLDIATLQRYLPASVKNALKPYYRKLLPNQLCVLLWVTFRCNYRCSYCPVVTRFDYSEIYGKADERTPEDWIAALDRLPKANVYISGGEPFLFKGLPSSSTGWASTRSSASSRTRRSRRAFTSRPSPGRSA